MDFLTFFAFQLYYSLFHMSKAGIGLTEHFSIFSGGGGGGGHFHIASDMDVRQIRV